ncbi:MAG: hypothetical protein PHT54_01275 [Candidatus Nanoarchaeia archaeon]|nr:hypothetical protein [Candidatus Nanoarchaeia archaeon]
MNWVLIVVGIIVLWLLIELLKHLFLRKTAKVLIMLILIGVLFLGTSKIMSDSGLIDQDNKVITTGATITDKILDNFGKNDKINIKEKLNISDK